MEEVGQAALAIDPGLAVFVQPEQLGTADAVKAAAPAYEGFAGHVLVLYGDTPLLRSETLKAVLGELDAGADVVVIGFEAADPTGYGRLLFDEKGRLAGIREEKDASTAERALTICNSGIMAFRTSETLVSLLGRDRQRQRQGRVLSDRRRGAGARKRPASARGPVESGRGARRECARRARHRRSADAAASAGRRHGGRRHPGRARDGVLQL